MGYLNNDRRHKFSSVAREETESGTYSLLDDARQPAVRRPIARDQATPPESGRPARAQDHQANAELMLATLSFSDPRSCDARREQANQLRQKAEDLRRQAVQLRQPIPDLGPLPDTWIGVSAAVA